MDSMPLSDVSAKLSVALLGAALMAAFASSAHAQQMYKWVDERGQVTYSNTPPPEASRANKLGVVEERVSVYSPDPTINRAMSEADAEARESKSSKRQREQAEANRRERAAAAEAKAKQRTAAYDRCVSERRVECESILTGVPSEASYGYTSPYGPAYIVAPPGRQPRPFRILEVPDQRVGINNAPPVGISTAPKVGISTTPPIGIDDRDSVGRPPRTRGTQFR